MDVFSSPSHPSGDATPQDGKDSVPKPAPTPGADEMARTYRSLVALSVTHPAWFDDFEATDVDVCDLSQLLHLLRTAPSDFSRGFLAGTLSMRTALSLMSGRPLF